MDQFTAAYIECALWSTNDESDDRGGDPMDANYGPDDLAPETLEAIVKDCAEFQANNADDIATWVSSQYTAAEMAGHDFWLTRNGHGVGFWDGDWERKVGERLTEASKLCGEVWLYIGDDGLIYHS